MGNSDTDNKASPQAPLIENKADLIEALSKGCKPEADFRIGTEHEKFAFRRCDLMPVPYEGERGIESILRYVEAKLGWDPIEDDGKIVGLKDPQYGGAISLEPGGQIELSGAPLETVHETCAEVGDHLDVMRGAAEKFNIRLHGIGTAPIWTYEQMPHMPKSRYQIMAPYMDKVGLLGKHMMFRSCTIQVNLDFSSEADMVQKMRASLALQPIATALFANSPFTEGKPNGFKSFRSEIWRHTDKHRTGMLPFVFDEGFGFEAYVDYALDVPMYFVVRHGRYIDCTGASFRDFLNGKLAQLPAQKPTKQDWEDHISTLFPEVRLKSFLEMRGADSGPWSQICALPALWVGLLYDSSSLQASLELTQGWSHQQRQQLRDQVPVSALDTKVGGIDVAHIACNMLELSAQGLKRRARFSSSGYDETIHLAPLEDIVRTGKTRADLMLENYFGPWARDASKALDVQN